MQNKRKMSGEWSAKKSLMVTILPSDLLIFLRKASHYIKELPLNLLHP